MFGWFRRKQVPSATPSSRPAHQHGRSPLNVPGPFYTCGNCLACGLPETEAPELLAPLDPDHQITHFIKQPQTPDEVERACSAINVCCVADLRYGGQDPAIINRLGNDPGACDFLIRRGRIVPSIPPRR